ncbi:aminoglycoside phosphotransferase family protein [Candidatus Bathyarchaeota archaeon]|nr:aminoglycoside phosphotransferase family protein [Candidatus Bathyarchaeota archaeon]
MEIALTGLESLEKYFREVYGSEAKILKVLELTSGREKKREELKGFGYGIPYLIEVSVKNETRRVVLETIRPGGFGHEHFSDRAQILLWQHSAFNKLPKHVRSIDVGAFTSSGALKSLGDCREFFILTEYVEGEPYYLDLEAIKSRGKASDLDIKRCLALSDYLVRIHSIKGENLEQLYIRRVRDLIGHGECIMGLIDSYPSGLNYANEKTLMNIEKKCVEWRWKLKKKTYRCSCVHGDFHPWNILFHEGLDFTVLDRSRGEWGEPADDLAAMTINYLFYSLQTYGEIKDPFKMMFEIFWENYLNKTGDEEILSVIQPFYAWRGLVIASPIWYPNLPTEIREKIFNFIKNVLGTEKFNPKIVSSYLEE